MPPCQLLTIAINHLLMYSTHMEQVYLISTLHYLWLLVTSNTHLRSLYFNAAYSLLRLYRKPKLSIALFYRRQSPRIVSHAKQLISDTVKQRPSKSLVLPFHRLHLPHQPHTLMVTTMMMMMQWPSISFARPQFHSQSLTWAARGLSQRDKRRIRDRSSRSHCMLGTSLKAPQNVQ